MKNIVLYILLFSVPVSFSGVARAQDSQEIFLTLNQAFELALKNSEQLKISSRNIDLAEQRTKVAELGTLPQLSTSLNYGYVSNSQIWSPDFSAHQTAKIPHHLTQLSLSATEVVFKGGEVTNNIKKALLEEQSAFFSHERSAQEIKFYVASRYFDIYKLLNQTLVFENNIQLSKNRLKNILSMQKQGMVTNNDVLRTRLIISDLELARRKTRNSAEILNQQFNMMIGAPQSAVLRPDSSLLKERYDEKNIAYFLNLAYQNNQSLKLTVLDSAVAQRNIKSLGTDRYPEIGLFAGSNFQRPYLNNIPAIDIYYNVWQTGVSIRYNISSLYQSPRKIRTGKIQLEQAIERQALQRQTVEVEVRSAYIRLLEARDELETYSQDLKSAQENYRIVEKKYFNQLALLTDITDASNTKVEAELRVATSRINISYAYYQLLKSIGTL